MLKDFKGTFPKVLKFCSPIQAVRLMTWLYKLLWKHIKTALLDLLSAVTMAQLGFVTRSATWPQQELSSPNKVNLMLNSSRLRVQTNCFSRTQLSNHSSCKLFRASVATQKFHKNGCRQSEITLISWSATKFRLDLVVQETLSGLGKKPASSPIS